MAGLPPGDPQLVSMIVNHLKTQGLFDQFRRDCLADVDTKPAYLNLKQRVDNFVSNHLSNHTWSPHLNKNQLRNNIRQLVLQSGMLEQGVDRIVAQVVDPKINHIFRPQVERVVRQFLSPDSCVEEPPMPPPSTEIKLDSDVLEQASSSAPPTTTASNAMSILDTITSLNQEASSRASTSGERGPKGQTPEEEEGDQDMSLLEEGENHHDEEAEEAKLASEVQALEVKTEDTQELMDWPKEGMADEVKTEEEEMGTQKQMEEGKDKAGVKTAGRPSEEKQDGDPLKSPSQIKQKTRERLKEEYSLEDSDLEGLSDITVSSVHTSDLSSFEGESDDEPPPSDSSDDGELLSDGERAGKKQHTGAETGDTGAETGEEEKEQKPRRKAYVHKPFLYSRYYSDSDDEVTVEERRRSAAKDKEERLLKRQQNRERMEEKRKQKAAQAEEDEKRQQRADSPSLDGPSAKEARKERKVLEKKMALNRKRKLDSRKEEDVSSKRKGDAGGEGSRKAEVKSATSKTPQQKLVRKVSEDSSDAKKLSDKSRTHSFILELEQGSQESLKQRSFGKFDRPSRKESHIKERKEKERSVSDERARLKHKQEKKTEADESPQKEGATAKASSEEKGEKKAKVKSDKKMPGNLREGRASVSESAADEGGPKDAAKKGKAPAVEGKAPAVEAAKAEKDKEREKEKNKVKEKEKAKGEKTLAKSDSKQLPRPDSTGSSEDRSDMEPGPDSGKKKEKHKEVLKRSKSHTEDRQGEKPKSKTDNKDGEREKAKTDPDTQKLNKPTCEMDKDPRRSKPTEKGKVVEKPRSKSREEAKTPLSSKTDKKAQSSEVKSKGGAAVGKHETTKEKKKEGNAKEHRKVPEEPPHEKSESKIAKKKLEKKDKIPENQDESQEEKKAFSEDKYDKSEKSSVSSQSLEAEELPKKRVLLQDTSTDSDPVTTTVTTSFSDDTYDALSDITPEPDEGETQLRLSELEPRSLPTAADALLTLMDICTSADARLPEDSALAPPEMTLHYADMKMKEAALTLLSMDPDSTVSTSLMTPDSRQDPEMNLPARQPMETTTAEAGEQHLSSNVQTVADIGPPAADLATVVSQQIAQILDEKPNSADVSDNSEKENYASAVQALVSLAPQDADTTSDDRQAPLTEEEDPVAELAPETQPVDKLPPPGDKQGDKQDAAQSEVADPETSTKVEAEAEDNQTEMEIDNISEVSVTQTEEENVAQEQSDRQNMGSDETEEARETGHGQQAQLVKEISKVSSSDSQGDVRGSDLSAKEENTDGRATSKQKLSSQKREEKDETNNQEQPSTEETDQEDKQKAKTPRRVASSTTSPEVEEDQAKEPEKAEEAATHRGRSSGAKDASNQKKDENKDEEKAAKSSLETPAETEERNEEDSELKKSGQLGDQAKLPLPHPVDTEGTASSDSKEITDTRKPSLKRKRSEEMEDSVEQSQAVEEEQQELNEQPIEDSACSPPESQAEDQEEIPEASENKPDDGEEEQPHDAPKKARRGRPSKAAAEDSDKKEKRSEEKESEQNDEEDDDDDDDETKTRTTTRAASRLEAERNKPSKPSTRASRQNVKEETAAGARGTRGQAAAVKGGRKREASPPAVRTRGGQKSEEPPSKRAKR